jgi:hypothetical protein
MLTEAYFISHPLSSFVIWCLQMNVQVDTKLPIPNGGNSFCPANRR